jgi:hypothetical protein
MGSRYPRQSRDRGGNRGWMMPALVAAIVVVAAIAIFRSRGGGAAAEVRTPVPSDVMQELAQVPIATWNAVGAHGATAPTWVGGATAAATAAKPVVLYVGAEYCPFCAAERWSMVTALARFGTFQNLAYSHSSSSDVYPSTPTFTFYGSTYTSPYIDFEPVETLTNIPGGPDGYTNLQTPTAAQQALLQKYNAAPYFTPAVAGHIPFLLVGERYAWVGSGFSPQDLHGLSQAQVAADLAAAKTTLAQAILANANEIAATICQVDGGRPAAVCGTPGVSAAVATLPTGAGK